MRPKLFIGSSTESVDYARAINQNLTDVADIMVWPHLGEKAGKSTLDALLEVAPQFQFAVFLLAPEDTVTIRGKRYIIARDNVLFELGLFLGKLDSRCVFFLVPEVPKADTSEEPLEFHIPSDLLGIIHLRYRWNHSLGFRPATEDACSTVRNRIQEWKETPWLFTPRDALTSHNEAFGKLADEFIQVIQAKLKVAYIGDFPDFFDKYVLPLVKRAKKRIEIGCDFPNYGAFSAYRAWHTYQKTLLKKKAEGVETNIVILSESRRKSFLQRQTASSPDEWATLIQQDKFANCLKAFEQRTNSLIDGPEKFSEIAVMEQRRTIEVLAPQVSYFGEIDTLMTVYLWIVDDAAIFSIPAFGKGRYAVEHAFQTTDEKFVIALRSLWKRYREAATEVNASGKS